MKLVVGTTASPLAMGSWTAPAVHNVGPGVLYADMQQTATVEEGFPIQPGTTYVFPSALASTGVEVSLIADAEDTEVRFLPGI